MSRVCDVSSSSDRVDGFPGSNNADLPLFCPTVKVTRQVSARLEVEPMEEGVLLHVRASHAGASTVLWKVQLCCGGWLAAHPQAKSDNAQGAALSLHGGLLFPW